MRKGLAIMIICLFLLSFLTGCWSRREVSDLALGLALGLDKNKNGDYIVSIQIINPGETAAADKGGGGGYDTPVTTYTTTGKILFEALRKLSTKVPRKVYLSHLRIVVIGEELAKEGIYDVLDFLSRDHEMRTDFYIIVAKDQPAENTLKILTSLEKIPANKLFFSLETSSEVWAATGKIKLTDLMDDIVSEGIQPTLTGITVIGDPKHGLTKANVETISPKAAFAYSGIAAFRQNKLVGWLNEEESKGFNYLKDQINNTVIVFKMNDDDIGVELIHSETEIIPHFNNNDISIEVKVTGEANVADVNTNLDLMNPTVIGELESKVNKRIEEVIITAVDKGQKEFASDIFGFGKRIHKTEPKEWEKIKKQWVELFPDVPVTVNVDIKIRRIGTISNPFHDQLKEE